MRRGLSIIVVTFACILSVAMIAISPLALTELEGLSKNWVGLANIGQAYGAISALISSLAVAGVAVSLLYQARAGRTARQHSIRTWQHELIRMEMDDPTLMTAMGAPWGLTIPAESARIREYLYIHMWISTWAGNYVIGEATASAVRRMAKGELFNGEPGRAYWTAIRESVLSGDKGKYRGFACIIDEEYQEVIARNLPVADAVKITDRIDDANSNRKTQLQQCALVGATLIAGILAGRKYGQMSRR